jgi:hypothetical protein
MDYVLEVDLVAMRFKPCFLKACPDIQKLISGRYTDT